MSTLQSVLNELEKHNLKEGGQGKWRCTSPFRPGADSMSFALTATDGEHGAYIDYVSGESGSLYGLADRLGIQRDRPSGRVPVANSKRPYSGLADYAAEKGVTADVFAADVWREESHKGGKRLAIKTDTGMRYRTLTGKGSPYYSESGYKACWYKLDSAIETARRANMPLVICNGEASTVVAQHHGVPAFCHTGGETFTIPDALLAQLADKIRDNFRGVHPSEVEIMVALDCDQAGHKGAAKTVSALRAKGFNARAVDLGLGDGGDVADFCKLFTDQAADRLIALPTLTIAPVPEKVKQNGTISAPGGSGEAAPPAPVADLPGDESYQVTDLRNAGRLVKWFGDRVKYVSAWNKYLLWDGTRWKLDTVMAVNQFAVQTIQGMYAEAARFEDKARTTAIRAIVGCESRTKMNAMLDVARPELAINPAGLDTDKWLLNCRNGTLDLRRRELHSQSPSDLITMRVEVDFDFAAKCPTWLAFLNRIFAGDKLLIAYIQRMVGTFLTGDTSEQKLFFLYGMGRNGKSTFVETIMRLLGEYAIRTPTESLMMSERSGGIPNDIALFRGMRLVTANETNEGQRLNEAKIKQLTSQEPIPARFLFGEWFSFYPTHKILMSGNHKPTVRGGDEGFWRRMVLIPCTVTIPPDEIDYALPEKLTAELPGILAWAVNGCTDWQQNKLGAPPPAIAAALAEYRSDMDVLATFLEEKCVLNPKCRIQANELYKLYQGWCEATGERQITQTQLGRKLKEAGYTSHRLNYGVLWDGIGIRAADPTLGV